jgi:hypothetical protein
LRPIARCPDMRPALSFPVRAASTPARSFPEVYRKPRAA